METEIKKAKDPSKEMVKHTFFYDGHKYKNDITAIVNGKAYKVKRGVEVTLPKFVFDVIVASEEADRETAKLIASLAKDD